MTVTINGTTGIAGTNGSAGTPAVQGEDTNTGIFFPAADTVAVATGGAERVRVDASGNLGLGVTPSAWKSDARGIDISPGNGFGYISGLYMGVFANSFLNSSGQHIYKTTSQASYYSQVLGQHAWYNAPSGTAGNSISFTQAMTLDASGNLLVGTTTISGDGISLLPRTSASGTTSQIAFNRASTTASGSVLAFLNAGTTVGTVQHTNTATSYNTSSDYRLKENVVPMQNALDTVAQLNPVTYTWKADGSAGQGFIAHELQAVVPDCVTGEKDAVDAEGNPQYQGVDTSFLVATLVKAIQELTARVAELEAK